MQKKPRKGTFGGSDRRAVGRSAYGCAGDCVQNTTTGFMLRVKMNFSAVVFLYAMKMTCRLLPLLFGGRMGL